MIIVRGRCTRPGNTGYKIIPQVLVGKCKTQPSGWVFISGLGAAHQSERLRCCLLAVLPIAPLSVFRHHLDADFCRKIVGLVFIKGGIPANAHH